MSNLDRLRELTQELCENEVGLGFEIATRDEVDRIFLETTTDDMYNDVLQILLKTFDSTLGAFGYIDRDNSLVVPSFTEKVWEKCKVKQTDKVRFPQESWGKSIWSEALRQKAVLWSNKESVVPKGHLPIRRNISAAIVYRKKSIGLLQVANKKEDYTEQDISLMKKIVNHIAPILWARLCLEWKENGTQRMERME